MPMAAGRRRHVRGSCSTVRPAPPSPRVHATPASASARTAPPPPRRGAAAAQGRRGGRSAAEVRRRGGEAATRSAGGEREREGERKVGDQRGRRRDRRMEIGQRSFTVDVAQSGAEKRPPFRSLKDTPFAIKSFSSSLASKKCSYQI